MIAEETAPTQAAPDLSVDGAASDVTPIQPSQVLDSVGTTLESGYLGETSQRYASVFDAPPEPAPPTVLGMTERLAWYAEEGHRHLEYEPRDLLTAAVLESATRISSLERELLIERDIRSKLEHQLAFFAEQLAKVQEVLPSRAAAVGADALARLRKVDPYALLVVLEDWGVGSFRHVRGAEVRLDHFPQLEEQVRAGLLVGPVRTTPTESEAIGRAEESLRDRLAEQARMERLRAEADVAAARAREESLTGLVAVSGLAG